MLVIKTFIGKNRPIFKHHVTGKTENIRALDDPELKACTTKTKVA